MNTYNRRRRNNTPSFGTLISGALFAYGAYKVITWTWNTYVDDDKESEEDEFEQQEEIAHRQLVQWRKPRHAKSNSAHKWRVRRDRMARCREEVAKAMLGFLPTMRRAIEEKTNTTNEARTLKNLRVQRDCGEIDEKKRKEMEKDLWEKIKVQAITRMMITAYAHTVLFVVLTVQVNLLGGRLFEDQMRDSSCNDKSSVAADSIDSYKKSHKLVLQRTYQHFFDKGMSCLLSTVEKNVSGILNTWDVADSSSLRMSRELFNEGIEDIRNLEILSENCASLGQAQNIVGFLIPPSLQQHKDTDDLASYILDETWDLLESPVFEDALRDCLDATFNFMRDEHWGAIFAVAGNQTESQRSSQQWITKPLAHVVTRLKHTSKSFYESNQKDSDPMLDHLGSSSRIEVNGYCSLMETLPSVLELADLSFH